MNKKIPLLTLGAALIAVPVLAAPGGDRNATQTRAEVQTRAAEMFARMDVNQDGKLDTADRAAKRAERGEKRAAADEASQGKRHAMRGHHGKRGGHHAMRMMGKADTDGDKAISQAEFQTAALARFDAADANKDGQVTAEERQAQRGAWRAKRGAAPAAPANQ